MNNLKQILIPNSLNLVLTLKFVGDSDPMNFFSDVSSMDIDFYHAMASYLILGGGNSKLSKGTPSNWILPDFARNLNSASSLVTKYIREALVECNDKSIAESSRDYEGTSLRFVKLFRAKF